MSLEYAIEYKCQMRRAYDEATLRALGRTSSLIARMVAETEESGRPPSEESVRFATRLGQELERSEQIADYCRQHCPACLNVMLEQEAPELRATLAARVEAIGCLGRISYPIEARFEHFLADRLQLIYDIVAPQEWPHLLHILLDPDSPFDGEATKELRRVTTSDGLRFFELRQPITLVARSGRLTTDHIFDLLAGFRSSDEGASGYQRELPVMALADYAELLEALLLNDLSSSERERLHSQGITYSQFVRFTYAVRLASRLEVRILLD